MTWLLWSLGAIVLWGFWGVVVKHTLSLIDWRLLLTVSLAGYILPLALVWTTLRPGSIAFSWGALGWAVLAGLLTQGAIIMFYRALETGRASLVVPITAIYPALTVLLAVLILKESLRPTQVLGVGLAVVAGFLLAKG